MQKKSHSQNPIHIHKSRIAMSSFFTISKSQQHKSKSQDENLLQFYFRFVLQSTFFIELIFILCISTNILLCIHIYFNCWPKLYITKLANKKINMYVHYRPIHFERFLQCPNKEREQKWMTIHSNQSIHF